MEHRVPSFAVGVSSEARRRGTRAISLLGQGGFCTGRIASPRKIPQQLPGGRDVIESTVTCVGRIFFSSIAGTRPNNGG